MPLTLILHLLINLQMSRTSGSLMVDSYRELKSESNCRQNYDILAAGQKDS